MEKDGFSKQKKIKIMWTTGVMIAIDVFCLKNESSVSINDINAKH